MLITALKQALHPLQFSGEIAQKPTTEREFYEY